MKTKILIVCLVLGISIVGACYGMMLIGGSTVAPAAGGNTISFVDPNGSVGANTTNATTLTLTVPSGTSDGDMMYAAVLSDTAQDITAPGGWTLIATQVTSSSSRLALFSHTASSEPASYDFTRTDTGVYGFVGVMACFEKTAGTWDPIQSTNTSSGTGSTLVSGSVTTTDGSFLIIAFGSDDATTVGTVSGMTITTHEEQASCAVGIWYESITTGSAVTRTWTPGSTGDLSSVATVLEAE